MRRKWGAHLARISSPSVLPIGVDHGSSKAGAAAVAGAIPSSWRTKLGGPAPTPTASPSTARAACWPAAPIRAATAPRWDTSGMFDLIAERKIAEALARGELDNLPGEGRPLELDDDALIPEE